MIEETELDDVRDEVEEVRERVRRVEQLLEADGQSPSDNTPTGTDHRDAAVLSVLEQSAGEPKPVELVKLYQRHTDVTNDATAKQRAKTLRQTDAYSEAVQK